ncbi:MAG TPA: DUF4389 domain-containing protein [Gaiellaceae bacterium]|nr:DUF4389 domain-containing protein [Gaiellaceae bacterium]
MEPLPIRLTVADDLSRNRLTVAFRLLLALPHLVWLLLWGLAAGVASVVLWLAILFEGRAPRILHGFVAGYVRYSTHVYAYLFLAADPFPGFAGSSAYPVDVEIDPPARQGRWGAFFRLVLALPALVVASALGGGPGADSSSAWSTGGVVAVVAFLGWFASLARARMPAGLRDLGTYAIGYGAQATGYLLLLTDRYPDSRPVHVSPAPLLPHHAVRLTLRDELRRDRVVIAFRLLLALPHFAWLSLWSLAAVLAAVAGWVVTLVRGTLPRPLHRFLAAYVRYAAHVTAFASLAGGPFPGFVGRQGSYPVDIEVDGAERQGRWGVLGRLVLGVPSLLVSTALAGALFAVALLGWFASLWRGRMPHGLRDLGATIVRYHAQTHAYLLLVTPRYPYACPVVEGAAPSTEPAALGPAAA